MTLETLDGEIFVHLERPLPIPLPSSVAGLRELLLSLTAMPENSAVMAELFDYAHGNRVWPWHLEDMVFQDFDHMLSELLNGEDLEKWSFYLNVRVLGIDCARRFSKPLSPV